MTDESKGRAYGPVYKSYVLALFTLVYVINFMDRQILVILQDQIKTDLGLKDAELGLLTGTSFAIMFSIAGLFIAPLAERRGRVLIASASLMIWSALTALSGLCRNFTSLCLARIGVGISEAGGSPPLLSLLADYFPARQRPLAIAIYSGGIYLGFLAAFLGGSVFAALYGWRMALMLAGLPGIAVGLLLLATVREPEHLASANEEGTAGPSGYAQLLAYLRQYPLFWLLVFGAAFRGVAGYGVGNFIPSYFLRVYHLPLVEVGQYLAFTNGIGGALGAVLGGLAASRMIRKDRLAAYKICWISGLLYLPLAASVVLVHDLRQAVILQFVSMAVYTSFYGLLLSECLGMVGSNQRAMASAVIIFVSTVIGLGIGPAIAGFVSDRTAAYFGTWSVGAGILSVLGFALLSFFLFTAALIRARRESGQGETGQDALCDTVQV